MLSFVINSVDPAKFASVSASIARATGDARHEIVGIHDAKSMCDGYRRGLARSAGDRIVFCHDDIELLMPDLPARLGRHFERFDVFGPVGTRKLVSMNWAHAGAEHLVGAMTGPRDGGAFGATFFGGEARQVDGVAALEGIFIAARREAALAIGWDAETFDDWHGYDTDFSFRAMLGGWRLGVVLDLAVIHYSKGSFGAGYERSFERFAAKHAGRVASGSSDVHVRTDIPMPDRDAIRAFFDHGDLGRWHRESRLRIDRARRTLESRPASLSTAGLDPRRPTHVSVRTAADPPSRNGACPCGSGRRYKECHGASGAGVRPAADAPRPPEGIR